MSKINAGNESFVKALSLFDEIGEIKARYLAGEVTELIAAGKTDKQIAAYIASQTPYDTGWDGSYKYDAVQEWIDVTRNLQVEGNDNYSSSTVKDVKVPDLVNEFVTTAKNKADDTGVNFGLAAAAAGLVIAGIAWRFLR